MREEIANILKQGRTGVKVTSNEIANFIQYPTSIEQLAGQILAIMRARVEAVENPYIEAAKHSVHSGFHKEGFEQCRAKVVKLFSEAE